VEDPEAHLDRLEISLTGAVAPDKPALRGSDTQTVVNGHFLWVSSPEKLSEFRANPQRYTGQLLDPVTHEWFVPNDDSPRCDMPEGILLFSDSDTARKFDGAQDSFPVHWH